MVSIKIALPFY